MVPGPLLLELLGGLFVGASLGLVGAGGAILSLPIFALVLGHAHRTASVEALVATGLISAYSAARAAAGRRIDYRRALAFALPGTAGAWIGAPVGGMLSDLAHAAIFATLAAIAAWRMIARAPEESDRPADPDAKSLAIAAGVGLAIGFLTAIIGVGGGFLLVPALVLVMRVPLRTAIGTSLLLITLNASIAFLSHLRHSEEQVRSIDWTAVAIVAGGGAVGSTLGSRLGGRLPERLVRRSFSSLLVLVAAAVLLEGLGFFSAGR